MIRNRRNFDVHRSFDDFASSVRHLTPLNKEIKTKMSINWFLPVVERSFSIDSMDFDRNSFCSVEETKSDENKRKDTKIMFVYLWIVVTSQRWNWICIGNFPIGIIEKFFEWSFFFFNYSTMSVVTWNHFICKISIRSPVFTNWLVRYESRQLRFLLNRFCRSSIFFSYEEIVESCLDVFSRWKCFTLSSLDLTSNAIRCFNRSMSLSRRDKPKCVDFFDKSVNIQTNHRFFQNRNRKICQHIEEWKKEPVEFFWHKQRDRSPLMKHSSIGRQTMKHHLFRDKKGKISPSSSYGLFLLSKKFLLVSQISIFFFSSTSIEK